MVCIASKLHCIFTRLNPGRTAPTTTKKGMDVCVLYGAGVVMSCAALFNVTLMIFVSLAADGVQGLNACFSPKACTAPTHRDREGEGRPNDLPTFVPTVRQEVLLMSPPAFLYGVGDCLQLIALSYTDPTLVQIASQSKMILSALLCRFWLGRPLSGLQWLLLVATSTILYSYVQLDFLVDKLSVAKLGKAAQDKAAQAQLIGISLLGLRVRGLT